MEWLYQVSTIVYAAPTAWSKCNFYVSEHWLKLHQDLAGGPKLASLVGY
jgi:hypothetical protein